MEKIEQLPAYDIAPGMSVEEMISLFFNSDALVEQPERVYRLQSGSDRLYYTYDEKGEPDFYISVTSMIQKTTPTSPHLIKWMADMGYEESKEYANERANYGTFMHSEIARLLIDRKLNLDSMQERLKDYIDANDLPNGFVSHVDELKKDLLAFAQFVYDHNVKPLAIEIVLTHKMGYAGAIDLPCTMDIEEKGFFGDKYKSGPNKGKDKETKRIRNVVAIVDFKSGRKGFYEDHEIQLEAYRRMWNAAYPDKPAEKIFNWAPSDWRTSPSYKLKDQSDSKNIEKFDHLVNLAMIEKDKRKKSVMIVSGEIDMDNPDLSKNIMNISIEELVKFV